MNFMVISEPNEKNIKYMDELANLCSDYELGFLTDEQLVEKLEKLGDNYGRR